MLRKFLNLRFGVIRVEEIFKAIFILGLIPVVLINFQTVEVFGDKIGLPYNNVISVVFAMALLLFFTLVSIVLWKILCELLFLVFKSLEVFINRNEK